MTHPGEIPAVGIYDHALFLAGGGQRYACALASLLQTSCRVTFITHRAVTIPRLENWYGLDLGLCEVKVIPLPYYEKRGLGLVDESFLPWFGPNPFDAVSAESGRYDLFINANMLTQVKPRAKASVFICHFPDHQKSRSFAADRYSALVTSSQYSAFWVQKKWGLSGAHCIYPSVDMAAAPVRKEPYILSAARFEHTGSKNQLEMINVFKTLCLEYPQATKDWSLVLAGASFERNPYLAKVTAHAAGHPKIRVLPDLTNEAMKNLYAGASLFWHACGLNTEDPARAEHFGMTTVEAMQNRCVPVVIGKGGQREIVEHGISGFLFGSAAEWRSYTLELIRDIEARKIMAQKAETRGAYFGKRHFEEKWFNLLSPLLKDSWHDRQGHLAPLRSLS